MKWCTLTTAALIPLAHAGLVSLTQQTPDASDVDSLNVGFGVAASDQGSASPVVSSCSTNAECLAKGLPLMAPRHPFARGVLQTRADEIVSFSHTGTVQYFIAPRTGDYNLIVNGAAGGSSFDAKWPQVGGRGAWLNATMTLTQGETLNIVVGGVGGQHATDPLGSNGGGGGTWIYSTAELSSGDQVGDTLHIVAGGGGGGYGRVSLGGDGSITTVPTPPNPSTVSVGIPGDAATGTGGGGGIADGTDNGFNGGGANGGGGAGWTSDGGDGRTPPRAPNNDIAQGKGGHGRDSGWAGGAASTLRNGSRYSGAGGYGGGGGSGWTAGGGGGGWAGGAGGGGFDLDAKQQVTSGGGGSSYWSEAVTITAAGVNGVRGDGSVTIVLPPI